MDLMKGRQRGRNGGKPRPHHQGGGGGGGHRNPNYEQNFGRMRGNAQQLLDKYLAMAREAHQQGDRVAAENFFQHADHYFRVLNERFQGQQQNNNQRRPNGQSYDRPYGEGGQNDGQQDGQNDGQNDGYDQYGGNQYGGNQGGGYQGNYNNQGQSDTSQQGTAHQSMMAADQPHMTANQPPQQHQQHQNQSQQHQPRQQAQHHQNQPHPRSDSDGDIGLPSSLFGTQPPPQTQFVQDAVPAGETGGEIAGEARAFRPRQGRRRRFRSDGPAAGQDPSDSSQS